MIEQIRTFLSDNPIENIETFFDNENIFWVDWREYDEDIVSYVNDELSEADQIEWKTIKSRYCYHKKRRKRDRYPLC